MRWEGKENVDPRADLSLKLGGTPPGVGDAAEDAFEASIASGEGDVVQVWRDYLAWAGDDPPLLQRACEALAADPRHAGDVRHLRLWVRLASSRPSPHETFEELERDGIGLAHALLYEAWAASLERQRLFGAAAEAYERGIGRGAQPLDRLRSRFEEFQGRMRQRACRGEARAGRGRGGEAAPSPPDGGARGQAAQGPSASPQASPLSSPGQDGEALLSRWTRERALESAQRSGGSAYQTPQHGAHFQTPRYSDSTAAAHSLCSSVARASPEGAGSTLLGCAEQEIDRAAALSEELERQNRGSAEQQPEEPRAEGAEDALSEADPLEASQVAADGARRSPAARSPERFLGAASGPTGPASAPVEAAAAAADASAGSAAGPPLPAEAPRGDLPRGSPGTPRRARTAQPRGAPRREPAAEARAVSGRPPSRWAATPITTASSTLFRGPGGGLAGAPLQWRRNEPEAQPRRDEDGAPGAEAASPPRWSALRARSPQPPRDEAAVNSPAAAGLGGSAGRGRPRAGSSPREGPPRWSALALRSPPRPGSAAGAEPAQATPPPGGGGGAAAAAVPPSTPPSRRRCSPLSPAEAPAAGGRSAASASAPGAGATARAAAEAEDALNATEAAAPPAPRDNAGAAPLASPRAAPREDVSVEERRAAALLAGLLEG